MPGVFDGAEVLVYVNMAEAAAASHTFGTADAAFTVAADDLGPAGNSITVALTDPAGNNAPLNVDVDGEDITVFLETDGTSTAVTTAQEAVDALNNDPAAKLLVNAFLPTTSDGSDPVVAAAATPLTGGALAGTPDYQPVARQQGADLEDSMDEIDASSKGDRFSITLPGRQSGSFDLEALYTFEDSTQARLRRAYQNREEIFVRIVLPAEVTGGTQATIEEARCRLTGFSRSFPDSDVATISAPVALQENWRTIQS